MDEPVSRKFRETGVSIVVDEDGGVSIETDMGTVPLGGGSHPDVETHESLGLALAEHTHEGGGAHPDLATHVALGLEADNHNHDGTYSPDAHDHDADYSATGHTHTHDHDADYSPTGHTHTHNHDSAYEASGATATHAAAADPHTGYLKENDASWTDLTDGGATTLHSHAGGGGGNPLDAWPVGSVYIAIDSTSPATRFGGGTWAAFGAGKMLVGLDSGDADFDTAEETGGAKTHTHAAHTGIITHTHPITDPGHVHDEYRNSATTGGLDGWAAGDTSTNTPLITGYDTGSKVTGVTVNAPVGAVSEYTHDSPSHLPPYIVVYMWKRTA
jgi:hypothetical protein